MSQQTTGQPGGNFPIGTRVRIRMMGTADIDLEGCFGTILGCFPGIDQVVFYNVHLDIPRRSGDRTVSLIESHLERLRSRLIRPGAMPPAMTIFLFQSGYDAEVFGFTSDAAGKNLPAEFSPWTRDGEGSAMRIGVGEGLAGAGASAAVIRAVKRDGFYLARSGAAPQI
jgi:hypothetical protein